MNRNDYDELIRQLSDTGKPTTEKTPNKTQQNQFLLRAGKLWKNTPHGLRRVLRKSEADAVLQECHAGQTSAHFKIRATSQRVHKRFWWPDMNRDIKAFVDTCDVCQRRDLPSKSQPLHPIPVTAPFARWGIDFVHLPKTDSGNRYALVAIDYFTKWPEVRATQNMRAATVAQFIFEEIICRHGCPEVIQSDRGSSFDNQLISELTERYDIKQKLVAPYRPQSNGLVERFNKTLGSALAKLAQQDVHTWDRYLSGVLLAYRTTQHATTRFSPFYLTYGRDPRLPIDLDWPQDQPEPPETLHKRVHNITARLDQSRAEVISSVERAQEKQKTAYDATIRPRTYNIGDKVLLLRSKLLNRHDAKLEPKWDGPFWVHDDFHNGTYKLRRMTDDRVIRNPAHSDRLKLYKQLLPEPRVLITPLPQPPTQTIPKQAEEPTDGTTNLAQQRAPLRRSQRLQQ